MGACTYTKEQKRQYLREWRKRNPDYHRIWQKDYREFGHGTGSKGSKVILGVHCRWNLFTQLKERNETQETH